ncbi:MAG TPA: threonine ammonia-lyase [Streptosporangiaceae bacterium]|nr:threonine ammonia-lyase [Streptosporangiaceae bacterium]
MRELAEVNYDDILRAHKVLRVVVRQTPMLHSKILADLVGGPVWLKCEHLQRAGSFKIRGAYWRISRLTDAERARGVIAASAGNHAQGVALAASVLGIRATVVMPENAPLPKIAATRGYGAEVVLHGAAIADSLAKAREIADETGSVFIHPFDHPDVIAGQGTVGVEIMDQCPQARTILVPAGGGGLVAGVALGVRGHQTAPVGAREAEAPEHVVAPEVIGVQAEAIAPFPGSLRAGRPVTVVASPTMADGIAVATPGDLTFEIISKLTSRVLTVTEDGLSRAMLLCLERAKQFVEPSGAAGVAALLEHPAEVEPPVVVLLSGGNIDPLLLSRVLRHGLAAAGRYLALRCRIFDLPGSLAALLATLAAHGTNVLDVAHERVSASLAIEEVEVMLQLETRGPEHKEEIIAALRATGYQLEFV